MILRDLLESIVLPKVKGPRRVALVSFLEGADVCKPTKKDEATGSLMEDDMAPPNLGDTPVEPAPEAASDPDEALKAGFRAAVVAVLDDDTMDVKAKLTKLKELLTTEEKLLSGVETPAAEEESPAAKEAAVAESKATAELAAYKARENVVTLCGQLNYPASQEEIACIAEISESRRRPFILNLIAKQRSPKSTTPGGAPPKSPPGAPAAAKDTKSFVAAITG